MFLHPYMALHTLFLSWYESLNGIMLLCQICEVAASN